MAVPNTEAAKLRAASFEELLNSGRRWSRSAIAAEQAFRKRNGFPLLTDEQAAALLGEAAAPAPAEAPPPAPVAAEPTSPVPAPPAPAVATPTSSAAATPTATVLELQKTGRKWSRSAIAAEQAQRKRNALPLLTDEEVTMLLGEAALPPTAAPAASAAATPAKPAAAPARAAAATSAPVAPVTRGGAANRYVGTPAVGTSKAAAAGGVATVGPENTEVNQKRRRLVWSAVVAFLAAWFVAFFRFFLPRTLFEPATVFKIGRPDEYSLGVDTKWQQKYRIWVDKTPDRLFVIYARCTHLGCTPDWKPSENKFKCPCHGSGYDSEGINFEGPAPRPMDRAHVELAPDGQIQVDVGHLFSWPKGQKSQFDDSGAYLPG